MKSNEHFPVMLNEVIEKLNIKKDGIYVDLTLGRAGHSSEILKKLSKDGILIGIDQDDEAIEYSKARLSKIGDNFKIIKSNFSNIDKALESLKINKIDGALFDLGVSSPQFDEGYRGFSYRFDSELDMRMNLENTLTAKEIVNTYSLKDLTRIFKEYGEEKYSYQIAKEIVKEREIKPINTTFELVEIIKKAKPKVELMKKGHPAKQVFQALRIEVNDELGVLEVGLRKAIELLNDNGRICVITFHSLEDRIVKNLFKEYSVIEGDRNNDFITPDKIEKPLYREVNKKVIVPLASEIEINPRSKSAKLRVLEKVEGRNYER